ncbi:MAG TPA: bifunctional riboflavin kinase/FAD synthetase [Xanthomonadaceae bacterium]|nr:bifunctional riboflavin kinase/FAD synthetase [Xanthomonadaceae bacterium]
MSRLFRDVDGGRLAPRGTVVCIGAFDGLHLGHRALIGRAVARARALGVDACVLSFEPLPREYFAPAGATPARLTWPRKKIATLIDAGADLIGLLRFDARLAALSATDFVRRVLVDRLGACEVWTGEDFRFGRGRAGDAALLAQLGPELGFRSRVLEPVQVDGARVSSSRIRELLAAGDFQRAAALLGRPYTMTGRVTRGTRLGRKLGYRTANLGLRGRTPALSGIFAARVHGVAATPWPAVASLGTRPTVQGGAPVLEAHLFGFDGDLYGRLIEVEFVARLRGEERFPDLESLVAQMDRDAAEARSVLGLEPTQRGAAA